ncbi:PREDICTED: uncharacterized protein LOC108633439 [Capra hircus]|uniref:uncharacterized protein LOC108633439 n=1 Tax=Capra hircus TaxID=9925 RepID=UPI000847377A|nr:PREDICTED: uncharacterized protein LOC108633439 [Capra hircus]
MAGHCRPPPHSTAAPGWPPRPPRAPPGAQREKARTAPHPPGKGLGGGGRARCDLRGALCLPSTFMDHRTPPFPSPAPHCGRLPAPGSPSLHSVVCFTILTEEGKRQRRLGGARGALRRPRGGCRGVGRPLTRHRPSWSQRQMREPSPTRAVPSPRGPPCASRAQYFLLWDCRPSTAFSISAASASVAFPSPRFTTDASAAGGCLAPKGRPPWVPTPRWHG